MLSQSQAPEQRELEAEVAQWPGGLQVARWGCTEWQAWDQMTSG